MVVVVVLQVWGSDFQFTNADVWFRQMDLLVAEINGNPGKYGAHVQYTTLAQYFDDLFARNQDPSPVSRDRAVYVWVYEWSVCAPAWGSVCVYVTLFMCGVHWLRADVLMPFCDSAFSVYMPCVAGLHNRGTPRLRCL
jgi:hypothetical protein